MPAIAMLTGSILLTALALWLVIEPTLWLAGIIRTPGVLRLIYSSEPYSRDSAVAALLQHAVLAALAMGMTVRLLYSCFAPQDDHNPQPRPVYLSLTIGVGARPGESSELQSSRGLASEFVRPVFGRGGTSRRLAAIIAIMDGRFSTLALRDQVRYWSVRQLPRFWHLDPRSSSAQEILVDGQILSDVFDLDHPMPPAEGTALSNDDPDRAIAQLHRLLGHEEPDFSDGRVALLVCPGCLEAACGALSVEVRRTESTVIWAEAGWQDETGKGEDVRPVRGPKTITFARGQYESVLADALSRWLEIARRPTGDSLVADLISYPVLAIAEEGPVYCFEDRDALEGMAESFVHGEFTLVVDARGFEYSYDEGDLPYIELKSGVPANAPDLTREVEERANYLRSRGSLRPTSLSSVANGEPVNSDFSQAFRLARKYNLG